MLPKMPGKMLYEKYLQDKIDPAKYNLSKEGDVKAELLYTSNSPARVDYVGREQLLEEERIVARQQRNGKTELHGADC